MSTAWQGSNDPKLKSWVPGANDPHTDFPIQNLPFGVFSVSAAADGRGRRVGVAIGEHIVDLAMLARAGLLGIEAEVFEQPRLNPFIALGQRAWRSLRAELSALLADQNPALRDAADLRARALVARTTAQLHLPISIPGYTDFYSSREHATNVGSMFRDPKNALLPNWLEMPIAYNGRASSVVVSGTAVRRPVGQLKSPDSERPVLAPCRKLDIELELGLVIGRDTDLGDRVDCSRAEEHIFGVVLLNDWSARDIQQWEYVPLGPFNSKGFATTISPWIVPLDALEPFRRAQPVQAPEPLPYLRQEGAHGFDIALEVLMRASGDDSVTTLSRTNFRYMYWSMAQQIAHHTVSGCNLRVGDLMGSGTISGPTADSCGSLLEITWNAQRPVTLDSGATRTFIEDGDTLTLRGGCQGDGYRIGFGDCVGTILQAAPSIPAG